VPGGRGNPSRNLEEEPRRRQACRHCRGRKQAPGPGYCVHAVALPWKAGHFSGQGFPLQPDGTLQCSAGKPLHPHDRRREANGSLRAVYGGSHRDCRPCPLREPRQWQGGATKKPCQASRAAASSDGRFCSSPLQDGSRREHGAPICNWDAINGSRWALRLHPPLRPPTQTRSLLAHSVLTLVSRGPSVWLAIHEARLLVRGPSSCSASYQPSPPFSDW
jgi:hypothetical protein